jgi:dephospho-CoA kinase
MNEVWVCFVPDEEAIERSARRDNANLEKIKAILSSQMSNMERIKKANVVFSSLWERDYTLKQVKKAWNFLHERLNSKL